MNRLIKMVVVLVIAVVIVMAARYFGLLPGPIVVGGQAISLML
jgi:hypothetical protein